MSGAKRINLLPRQANAKRAARSSSGKPSMKLPIMPLFLLLVAGTGGFSLWKSGIIKPVALQASSGDMIKLRKSKNALQQQLDDAQQVLASAQSTLREQQQELTAKRRLLTETKNDAAPLSSVLIQMATLVPGEVWLTKLNFSGQSLNITGVSQDTGAVTAFMDRLDQSGKFKDTTFAYTKRSAPTAKSGQTEISPSTTFTFEISTTPVLVLQKPLKAAERAS